MSETPITKPLIGILKTEGVEKAGGRRHLRSA